MGVIQINICCHLSTRFLSVSAEKFEVEADFEVTLELRTAYTQGVILTTSHRRGKRALALEIHEGQVTCSFYQRFPINLIIQFCNHKYKLDVDQKWPQKTKNNPRKKCRDFLEHLLLAILGQHPALAVWYKALLYLVQLFCHCVTIVFIKALNTHMFKEEFC